MINPVLLLLLAINGGVLGLFDQAEFASGQIGIPKLPAPTQVLNLSPKKFPNRNIFAQPKSPVGGLFGEYLGDLQETNGLAVGTARFEEDLTKKIAPVEMAHVEKRILSEGKSSNYSSYPSFSDAGYTYSSTPPSTTVTASSNHHHHHHGRRQRHRMPARDKNNRKDGQRKPKLHNPYAQNLRVDKAKVATKKADNNDPNLPYRPKYPASPYFGMCRLEDFQYDTKGDKIGRGGFGKVYSAVHKPTGIAVALKKVSVQSIRKNAKHVENEETIHHAIVHPYFTKHLCTMRSESGDIFFAMELVPGKNLAKRLPEIHPIPAEKLANMVAQMVVALEYLHSHCIIYRDLKAENVLIDGDGTVKFIDFGLSVHDCDNRMSNIAGTLEYTAPEMAARKKYGRAVDWYSLGILLFNLKKAKLPMTRRQVGDREVFLERIAQGLEFEPTGDKHADDLIAHLTQRDPRQRWGMTVETQKMIRAHPFFKAVNWAAIEGETRCAIQYPKLIKAVELEEQEADAAAAA